MKPKFKYSPVTKEFYQRNIKILEKELPVVFNKRVPLPLAIGIHKDLKARFGFTRKETSVILAYWTRRYEYVYSAISIGLRFNLDGQVVEPIEQAHINGFSRVSDRFNGKKTYRFKRSWFANPLSQQPPFVVQPFTMYQPKQEA